MYVCANFLAVYQSRGIVDTSTFASCLGVVYLLASSFNILFNRIVTFRTGGSGALIFTRGVALIQPIYISNITA